MIPFVFLSKASANTVYVNSELDNVNISSTVLVFEDSTCELSIEKIIDNENLDFSLTNNKNYDFFLFDHFRSCPWINFKLVNTDSNSIQFFLNIDNYGLSRVNWFTFNRNGKVDEILTGDDLNFSDRPVKDLNYLLPIEMSANDTLNCYLNLYRGSTIIYTNLTLQSTENFVENSSVEKYKIGILIGSCLFYLIMGFIVFLFFRTKLLAYYLLLILTMFIYCLIGEGLGYQYLWGESSKLVIRIVNIGIPISQLLLFSIFSLTFFQAKRNYPKIYFLIYKILFFILLQIVFGIPILLFLKDTFYPYKIISFTLICFLQSTVVSVYILILILSLKEYLKSRTLEKASFVVVIILYLIFISFVFLQSSGVILYWSLLKYSFFPVFIFEMSVLSFIVFQKYKKDREEKGRLIILSKKNQIKIANKLIEGQELERQRIASDLHDNLGSLLSISKLYLSQMELSNKQEIISLVEKSQKSTRSISNSLMPKVLISIGIIQAIKDLISNLEQKYLLNIDLGYNKLQHNYSIFNKIYIYRIIEELLSISINLSIATYITLQITEHKESLNLIIENDGQHPILATKNLLARIKTLKGEIFIDENTSHGNNVVVDLSL